MSATLTNQFPTQLKDYITVMFEYRKQTLPKNTPAVFIVFDNLNRVLVVSSSKNIGGYFERGASVTPLRKAGATRIYYKPMLNADSSVISAEVARLRTEFPTRLLAKTPGSFSQKTDITQFTKQASDRASLLQLFIDLTLLKKEIINQLSEVTPLVATIVSEIEGGYETPTNKLNTRTITSYEYSYRVKELEAQLTALQTQIKNQKRIEELNGTAQLVGSNSYPVVTSKKVDSSNEAAQLSQFTRIRNAIAMFVKI